ncbi:MAG TPA: radical SAM protein, partial [Candidatus Korarchaeota archaeon]|nr:radical SAM protein [Candidatus Korarchaeota archaeon]
MEKRLRDGNRLKETLRSSRTALVKVSERSKIPLIGAIPFGLIDRGTNVIQVRPSSMCPLSCIFCSTDAGPNSRTRIAEYLVDLDYIISYFERLVDFKGIEDIEAHIDTVGDPLTYPHLIELIRRLKR